MMKALLATALLFVAGNAVAADLPVRKAPEKVYADPQMWGGFYVGGHIGSAWLEAEAGPFNAKADGMVYGGHFGVNYQKGVMVVGLEAALTSYDRATKFGGSTTGCDCFVGDLKGKLGFTLAPSILVYGTAGGFWHNAGLPANIVPSFGWLAGGGIAWLPFNDHIVVSAEALYRSLGNDTSFVTVTGWELTLRAAYKI